MTFLIVFLTAFYWSFIYVCFTSGILGRLSCHGKKHSQTILTIESIIKLLAASTFMIDFFCKSMVASNFCDDRKSTLNLLTSFKAFRKESNLNDIFNAPCT